MLPDGGNDLLTWWLTSQNPCISCSFLSYLRFVSSWLSVSSAHSGRQHCRPGRRRRPASLRRHGEILRLINRRQFCLNKLQTWNWFQKIHYKSSTQCHTTFQIETTCNLGNHSIDLSNAWLDLSLKKTSNHSMVLKSHQTIYGCFTTLKLFVSAPYTTMLKQQS